MNSHPVSTPICGWLLPNNLDNSLMVYDAQGRALGSLNRGGRWEPAPGSQPSVVRWPLPNPHLHRVISYLQDQERQGKVSYQGKITSFGNYSVTDANAGWTADQFNGANGDFFLEIISGPYTGLMTDILATTVPGSMLTIADDLSSRLTGGERYQIRKRFFLDAFLTVIENALENIDPEYAGGHEALALLMGRPIAVARVSLNLEMQGYPAIDQDWNVFRQDMDRTFQNESKDQKRETEDYTEVEIPIRIGEYKQLNDGLVGYWIEEEGRYKANKFYAPQTAPETDLPATIAVHRNDQPFNIIQSINSPPVKLTVLLDPRGAVHATSGILPTKAIQIPADQFVEALRNIEVTFLSAPILTDRDKINLPLPEEPGYVWSWCEKENGVWGSVTKIGQVTAEPTAAPQELREGWLKLTEKGQP
jgi:hypothetical protein